MRKLIFITMIMMIIPHLTSAQKNLNQPKKVKPLYGGYIGLGYGVLTDELSDHFHNPIMLPITADFVYKYFVAQLNLDAGWAKVKKTMTFDDGTSWDKGQNAFHQVIGLNIGFGVYNSKTLRITPIIGYSFNTIYKNWWSKSDIYQNEPDSNNLNIGFLMDFKNSFVSKKNASASKNDDYAGLRVSGGAYIPYSDHGDNSQYYNGVTIYLSVGIVLLNFL